MSEHCHSRLKFKGDGYKRTQQLHAPAALKVIASGQQTLRRIPHSATKREVRLAKMRARHLPTRKRALRRRAA